MIRLLKLQTPTKARIAILQCSNQIQTHGTFENNWEIPSLKLEGCLITHGPSKRFECFYM